MAEDWQRCEKTHHVGDDRDPTVTWRDLGLTCDTCYAAIGDRRSLQALLDAERQRAEKAERERDDAYRRGRSDAAGMNELRAIQAERGERILRERVEEVERARDEWHGRAFEQGGLRAAAEAKLIEVEAERDSAREQLRRTFDHADCSAAIEELEAKHDILASLDAAGYKRYARTLRDALAAIEAWSEGNDDEAAP